jgi:hypothetical protein
MASTCHRRGVGFKFGKSLKFEGGVVKKVVLVLVLEVQVVVVPWQHSHTPQDNTPTQPRRSSALYLRVPSIKRRDDEDETNAARETAICYWINVRLKR